MTMDAKGTPLDLNVLTDVSDGYRSVGNQDNDGCITRAGSIQIECMTNPERFQILLQDGKFRNLRKPLLPTKPATISLNKSSLYAVVQECRKAWEEALVDDETTPVEAAGGRGQEKFSPYERAWDNPVDKRTFHKIAAKLAVAGDRLFATVFERDYGTNLDAIARELRTTAASEELALTVYANEFHLPWGMLYTHPDPKMGLAKDGSNFDKRGFWGYQHIVEQFTNIVELADHLVAREGKLDFCATLHEKIDQQFKVRCIASHNDFIRASGDRLRYEEWTKKVQVENALSSEKFKYQVLYFLCHAKGAGTTEEPNLALSLVELADGQIDASEIRFWIKRRFNGMHPLVFINACRGGQLGTLVYSNFTLATVFLEHGAGCVVGPQTDVPAVFAGEYGKCFFERLIADKDPPPRVGVILRNVNQYMWDQHNNPFGLAYSLYAGADCHVRWNNGGEK